MTRPAPPGWEWVRAGSRLDFALVRHYRLAEVADPAPGLAAGGVDYALLLPTDPLARSEILLAAEAAQKLEAAEAARRRREGPLGWGLGW